MCIYVFINYYLWNIVYDLITIWHGCWSLTSTIIDMAVHSLGIALIFQVRSSHDAQLVKANIWLKLGHNIVRWEVLEKSEKDLNQFHLRLRMAVHSLGIALIF